MKNLRRILALILTFSMLLTMSVPAFGEETLGTVRLGAVEGINGTNGENSETNKENSETNKENSETNKENSETNKENSETNKENSETNGENSETNKENSETNKENSDTNKENSEANKENSETNKESSETNKESSETNKESSETNKENSETNGENSEANKENSETNKENSETNKENSETNGENSETNKENSETNKENSETNKENSETNGGTTGTNGGTTGTNEGTTGTDEGTIGTNGENSDTKDETPVETASVPVKKLAMVGGSLLKTASSPISVDVTITLFDTTVVYDGENHAISFTYPETIEKTVDSATYTYTISVSVKDDKKYANVSDNPDGYGYVADDFNVTANCSNEDAPQASTNVTLASGTAKLKITPKDVDVKPDTSDTTKWTSVFGTNPNDISKLVSFSDSNAKKDNIKLVVADDANNAITLTNASDAKEYGIKFQYDNSDVGASKEVGNYNYKFDVGTTKYVITKKEVNVTPDMTDASRWTSVYGSAPKDISSLVTFNPAEAYNEKIKLVTTQALSADSNAGEYDIKFQYDGTDIGDTNEKEVDNYLYKFSTEGLKYTIAPKGVVITPNQGLSSVYGGEIADIANSFTYSDVGAPKLEGYTLKTAATREDHVGDYSLSMLDGGGTAVTWPVKSANGNYEYSFDDSVKYSITALPVTLSLKGTPSKTYGLTDAAVNFDQYRTATYETGKSEKAEAEILSELNVQVTRTGAGTEDKECAATYDYSNFQIAYDTENANYAVTVAQTAPEFSFTITALPVTLSLKGTPSKTYGLTDAAAGLDFNQNRTATYETGKSEKAEAKILSELNVQVTRIGAGTEDKERAATYDYSNFQIAYDTENANYAVTVAQTAPEFSFTITALPVTLSLKGTPSKTYGLTDAAVNFDQYRTATYETGKSEKKEADILSELNVQVTRIGAGTEDKERAATYDYSNFQIAYDTENANYAVTVAQTAPEFIFTIGAMPVTLTLAGTPSKTYGVTDADAGLNFNDYLQVVLPDGFTESDADEAKDVLKPVVTRIDAGEKEKENANTYDYSNFEIAYTANNDYAVTVAAVAPDFAFTINPLPVDLSLSGKPSKIYGELDSVKVGDWTQKYAALRWNETGNTLKRDDILGELKISVTRNGDVATEAGKIVGNAVEQAKEYTYGDFTVDYDATNTNYTVTPVEATKDVFAFTINPLPVDLSLSGKPNKIYGELDSVVGDWTQQYAALSWVEAGNTLKRDDILGELKISVTRNGDVATEAGKIVGNTVEKAKDYTYGDFTVDYDATNTNYTVTPVEASKEAFAFTINPLPVDLSLSGKPNKIYGELDSVVGDWTQQYAALSWNETGNTLKRDDILGELKISVTRNGDVATEAGKIVGNAVEQAKEYTYGDFTADYDATNTNYTVTPVEATKDVFAFTINPLEVDLSLSGKPNKIYGELDSVVGDWTQQYAALSWVEAGNTLKREDVLGELKISVTRNGDVATEAGKIVGNTVEKAKDYTYGDFTVDYDKENGNYAVTPVEASKEKFVFAINKLAVTLSLSGDAEKNIGKVANPSKDYGAIDAYSKLDFNLYRYADWTKTDNVLTQKEILDELGVTVTRTGESKDLNVEKVGDYGISKFEIKTTRPEDNYTVTIVNKDEEAKDFTFTIKNNINIDSVAWKAGTVTTRTAAKGASVEGVIDVSFESPDVTLDVSMTVTVKLDLSGTNTYLTDVGKADLEAMTLTGSFIGKNGTITIPGPDALEKYVKNGDAWQGGLPVGTKLTIVGVQLGDVAGTVSGKTPSLPVGGFDVKQQDIAVKVAVTEEGKTMYKLDSGFVVGPNAEIAISHDSPLDEWMILSSANGSKTVKVKTGETVTVKASELHEGEYGVLGLGTCVDGIYIAETPLTTITIAMVDDVHLNSTPWSSAFVLDNIVNTGTKATFENRGEQVQVTLPERPQAGSTITIAIDGLAGIPSITAGSDTTYTFDVFALWNVNPEALIRSGAGIRVSYTDAVGNELTSQGSGSVTKSTGRTIGINMTTVADNSDGSAGAGTVKIYGEASNYERVVITINGKSFTADVSGSGNYELNKSGQWELTLNLADFDLSTGKVTIRAAYEDLNGVAERTFNYKAEVMPVLLTSPALASYDKLYGFAEYGTTVHVTFNGEDYNTKKNPEMFLTGDAGNTVSVYEYFPESADSYFYWIFQTPKRMESSDDISVWYMDFTGSNKSKVARSIKVEETSKFNTVAEVLGANVIDYISMDKDETTGEGIPGTGEMDQHYVVPVDLAALRSGEIMNLPVLAFTGYKVGEVQLSMNDAGKMVVTPKFGENDAIKVGKGAIKLFNTKPSIQALRAVTPNEEVAESTFDVSAYGNLVWMSARFEVELDYVHIGRLNDFCALTPYDSGSDNRLQAYAKNFSEYYDDYSKFLDKTDYIADEAEDAAA